MRALAVALLACCLHAVVVAAQDQEWKVHLALYRDYGGRIILVRRKDDGTRPVSATFAVRTPAPSSVWNLAPHERGAI